MTQVPVPNAPASPFGARLRQWRTVRGLSQLSLATEAGSTARHVSFLETGRSRPSRDMVLRLADVLAVPLRDRNQLLEAAGIAPAFPEAALQERELAPFRRVIDSLLTAHEPFPGLVLDAHADVIAVNRACAVLFGGDLTGTNMIERYFADPAARNAIANWPDIAWAAVGRLRKQLRQAPLDERLRSLVGLAEAAAADVHPVTGSEHGLVACPWFRAGNTVIKTIVVAARFDTAAEITLDELRIELFYPQDAAAEQFFRSVAAK
jgi:transcriptional regulator with XRE-family HTH domain